MRSGGKMGNQQNVGYQRCINRYQRYTVVYIQLGPSIASASRDETFRAGASSSEIACLGRTMENNSMWLSSANVANLPRIYRFGSSCVRLKFTTLKKQFWPEICPQRSTPLEGRRDHFNMWKPNSFSVRVCFSSFVFTSPGLHQPFFHEKWIKIGMFHDVSAVSPLYKPCHAFFGHPRNCFRISQEPVGHLIELLPCRPIVSTRHSAAIQGACRFVPLVNIKIAGIYGCSSH